MVQASTPDPHIEAYLREFERNPLIRYFYGRPGKGGASPGQQSVHRKLDRYRALRAANQLGKAQPVDEPVLTPTGWRAIGSLEVGDEVIAGDGSVAAVVGVYPQGVRPVFRVTFDDGATTRCCEEHLWRVKVGDAWTVKALADIRAEGGSAVIPALVAADLAGVPVALDGLGTKRERVLHTIAPDGDAECVCIAVAHPDHTYITRDFIVTHNTVCGAAEAWCHGLGTHPYRSVPPPPSVGWIMIPDLENDWSKVSAALHALEPPGAIAEGCRYDPAKGYTYRSRRMVMLANGSMMFPKSGTQQLLALAGSAIDWAWFDEPPKESHWGEALTRVAVKGGSVWLTYTPVGRPLTWLKTFIHGDPEQDIPGRPEWVAGEIVLTLTVENAPHRSPESIAAQIDSYSPWELRQRVFADWEGVTAGRRFGSFNEGCVVTWEQMPAEFDEIRLTWDHGETEKSQVGYILGIAGRRVFLLAEVISKAHSTPHEDAEGIVAAMERLGVSVFNISKAVGDTNSSGKLGAGASLNVMLEEAIARVLKMQSLPFEITKPDKRGGSVLRDEKAMNHAMKEGRWFVHESCTAFINSAQHYTGAEKDLKHYIDSARYGCQDIILNRAAERAQPTLIG